MTDRMEPRTRIHLYACSMAAGLSSPSSVMPVIGHEGRRSEGIYHFMFAPTDEQDGDAQRANMSAFAVRHARQTHLCPQGQSS